MTLNSAILAGAAIVAAAILGAQLVAPYRLVHPLNEGYWRLNTVTGEARPCYREYDDQLERRLVCK